MPTHSQTPNKDRPQAFCKRHPALKVARLRALDWIRHEKNIYAKVVNWFDLLRIQLAETGVMLEDAQDSCEKAKLNEDDSKSVEPILKHCEQALAGSRPDFFREEHTSRRSHPILVEDQ